MESLPVPSMQAMVAATGGASAPPRYLRPKTSADAAAGKGEVEIPIIDFQKLQCNWCLQLINYGVPDDAVEGMKTKIEGFFQSPAETKQQFAQERGQLEGYGQLFVVSEDQ